MIPLKQFFLGCLILSFLLPSTFSLWGSHKANENGLQGFAPKVFIDCNSCDHNFIRTEVTFVNYVSDSQSADVHIMITQQRTGSGGSEFTLLFIGRNKFAGVEQTKKYVSDASANKDDRRKGMVRVLKLGLIKYVSDTPLEEFLSVRFNKKMKAKPSKDNWNNWVFGTGARGNFEGEDLSKNYSYAFSFWGNRTTENWKFKFWLNTRYKRNEYEIDEETIISDSTRRIFYTQLVKSLGPHWSVGGTITTSSNTYENNTLRLNFSPAIEFNLFPYSQSTRRFMRFMYKIGYNYNKYIEETIFDKTSEQLFSQSLSAVFGMKEPWGTIAAELKGSHYFHDFSKNKIELAIELDLKVFKGLSFNIFSSFSKVSDQITLPKGEASLDEVLLQLKQLATGFRYEVSFGLRFRFGSIYNNVVNPRFGN